MCSYSCVQINVSLRKLIYPNASAIIFLDHEYEETEKICINKQEKMFSVVTKLHAHLRETNMYTKSVKSKNHLGVKAIKNKTPLCEN